MTKFIRIYTKDILKYSYNFLLNENTNNVARFLPFLQSILYRVGQVRNTYPLDNKIHILLISSDTDIIIPTALVDIEQLKQDIKLQIKQFLEDTFDILLYISRRLLFSLLGEIE